MPEETKRLAEKGKVTHLWVPGHAGSEGTEEADELARKGTAPPNFDKGV